MNYDMFRSKGHVLNMNEWTLQFHNVLLTFIAGLLCIEGFESDWLEKPGSTVAFFKLWVPAVDLTLPKLLRGFSIRTLSADTNTFEN